MPGGPTAGVRLAAVLRVFICGVLLAVAVTVNASAVHWRQNLADSHLFGYYGWCVSQGARPYLDVWDNKPPGIWWVNAAAFRLFGEGIAAEIWICSAAVAATLIAFAAIAVTVYHRSLLLPAVLTACALLTHVGYECGGNRTETFVVLFETLAVLGYVRWLRGRRLAWLGLAGLFAGAARPGCADCRAAFGRGGGCSLRLHRGERGRRQCRASGALLEGEAGLVRPPAARTGPVRVTGGRARAADGAPRADLCLGLESRNLPLRVSALRFALRDA